MWEGLQSRSSWLSRVRCSVAAPSCSEGVRRPPVGRGVLPIHGRPFRPPACTSSNPLAACRRPGCPGHTGAKSFGTGVTPASGPRPRGGATDSSAASSDWPHLNPLVLQASDPSRLAVRVFRAGLRCARCTRSASPRSGVSTKLSHGWRSGGAHGWASVAEGRMPVSDPRVDGQDAVSDGRAAIPRCGGWRCEVVADSQKELRD
jgi:hypothetical protein